MTTKESSTESDNHGLDDDFTWPEIDCTGLTQEETLLARQLQMCWFFANPLIEQFKACLKLRTANGDYAHIAGRAGALIIKELHDTTRTSNSLIAKLWGKPSKEFEAPDQFLERHFPQITAVRNASVHQAELLNPVKQTDHLLKSGYKAKGLELSDSFEIHAMYVGFKGDNYNFTWNGELVGYPLNGQSYQVLLKTRLLMAQRMPKSTISQA